jgi:uncharacterized repeat protein (TIGR03847 family)
VSRLELGPAQRFVAGAVGPPGQRRFYIEVDAGGESHRYLLEKGQVVALAQRSLELLAENGVIPDREAVEMVQQRGLQVEESDEVDFRVGDIALQLQQSELVSVMLDPVEEGGEGVSFVVAPEQLQAMAASALETAALGRPICPRCRLPMDPDGHDCPAVNGHRTGG